MQYLVAGAGSRPGKTYVIQLMLKALRERAESVVAAKPISCGDRRDVRSSRECSSEVLALDELNPIYLKNATDPYVASFLEKAPIDLSLAVACVDSLAARFDNVLVEATGGVECPLTEQATTADFAALLGLSVILVVNNTRGAMSELILAYRALQARKVVCAGVVMNKCDEDWDTACVTNANFIHQLTGLPILAELIYEQDYLDLW